MSRKKKATAALPMKKANVSPELALQLLESLERLADHDTYETEYDGQMLTYCHFCGWLEHDEHKPDCAFLAAHKLIADAYASELGSLRAQAGNPIPTLANSDFESRQAQALQAAWLDGYGSGRDAEFVGDEAQNDAFNNSATLALCVAIDQAPSIPQGWIPVSERLPDHDMDVLLVVREGGGIDTDSYYKMREESGGFSYYQKSVTHWQPLPASPQPTVKE